MARSPKKSTLAPTHPADGLYYLDATILKDEGACREHRSYWYKIHGRGPTPVTFANLLAHEQYCQQEYHSSGTYWLNYHMYSAGRITHSEMCEYETVYYHTANVIFCRNDFRAMRRRVKALMDILAKRAKREGRLP